MNDTKLNYSLLTALSAFIADARNEGFSFKPSQIVRDKDYCNDIMAIVASQGSDALNASAINIINRCGNLDGVHEITEPWAATPSEITAGGMAN
jgi:hypothetical protein